MRNENVSSTKNGVRCSYFYRKWMLNKYIPHIPTPPPFKENVGLGSGAPGDCFAILRGKKSFEVRKKMDI